MNAKCCVGRPERLDEARKRLGFSYTELGKRVGRIARRAIGPSTARRWCLPAGSAEARRPRSAEDYRAVFLVTEGAVTPNSFYDIEEWSADLSQLSDEERAA